MATLTMKLCAAAATAAIALSCAPVGSATPVVPFGATQTLTNADGLVVTGYSVNYLAPSVDTIPYPVAGRLYQASVTVEAVKGTVTPLLPLFNARAANGDTYRMLAVPTWGGVQGLTLAEGQTSSGRIYFDVVGETPNSVVYNNGTRDLLIWVGDAMPDPAPPAPPPHDPMMPHNSGF